jgi:predicted nucleotidyltransferase
MAANGLEIGFLLDHQWYALRGEMEISKRPAQISLASVLADSGTPYAIIDGVALQIHQAEPRTTLDIDLAVASFDTIPRDELQAAGFSMTGQFAHSENWVGPEGVPVQFTEDPALGPALERAVEIELAGVQLRVIGRTDLLHEKLRAGTDPARRRSKRLQDLADAQSLLEETPELRAELSAAEQAILAALPD